MEKHSAIAPELIVAYQETNYEVHERVPFVLHVGVHSPALLLAHNVRNTNSSSFITAWNPRSEVTSGFENMARQGRLKKHLELCGLAFVDGVGWHPAKTWPPEESLLVYGLSRADACSLGERLDQNALIWNSESAVPELVLLR